MLSNDHLNNLMALSAPMRFAAGDDPKVLYQSQEGRIAASIKNIANLIRKIIDTDQEIFSLQTRLGRESVKSSPKGDRLIIAIGKQIRELEEYFPDNAWNPYVELLRDQLRKHPALIDAHKQVKSASGLVAQFLLIQLTGFVDGLRRAGRAKKFLSQLDNRRRQCEKNQASAERYFNIILDEQTSKVLAIRIDLACGSETSERRGITDTVDVERAREEFARFIRHVRENYALEGWMASFEYGLKTGYHFHVLILLDGQEARRDETIAMLLGEHWINVITEGRGRYYNCNAVWYPEDGIGMIHHYDTAKRAILLSKVVPYLTKMDFWLKFQKNGKSKSFIRGSTPKKKIGIGRPRKPMEGHLAESTPQPASGQGWHAAGHPPGAGCFGP